MVSTDQYYEEIHRHHLFASMTREQLGQVLETMSILRLEEGESLFKRDQHARRFFLLHSGQIKLYRLSVDGTEKVIEVVAPKQTFAEAIMFMERQTYPVNADALIPSEVFAFDNKTFMKILRENTDNCFQVLADMSMRLRRRLNDIEALSLQNATLRFVNYLLQQLPEDVQGPSDVQLPIPKSVVASRLSIQPESFSRILHNLSEAGLIDVKGPTIHINDLQGLRTFSS